MPRSRRVQRAPAARNPFSGRWRITWMSNWDQDFVDEEVPGHLTFAPRQTGSFQFGLIHAQMDYRIGVGVKPRRVEFTWHGFEEYTELNGRGHAEIVDAELRGHLYIHLGDDSAYRAVKQAVVARRGGNR